MLEPSRGFIRQAHLTWPFSLVRAALRSPPTCWGEAPLSGVSTRPHPAGATRLATIVHLICAEVTSHLLGRSAFTGSRHKAPRGRQLSLATTSPSSHIGESPNPSREGLGLCITSYDYERQVNTCVRPICECTPGLRGAAQRPTPREAHFPPHWASKGGVGRTSVQLEDLG